MPRISLNKITNYLMFLILSAFSAGCMYIFSVTLVSRLQGDTPSPIIPWTTLQIGFVLLVIPFLGKRIYAKVVDVQEDVELPGGAALFVGFLQGLLYGGTLLIIAGAVIFCTGAERLLDPAIPRYTLIALAVTGCAGAFYAQKKVARKARLWLLLALICQFVTISTMRQLLGLFPLKYDYRTEEFAEKSMPLADKTVIEKLIPDGANKIHLYGTRGDHARIQCNTTLEKIKQFAEAQKYSIETASADDFILTDNKNAVFHFNVKSGVLSGYFKHDGLPETLRRPENAKKMPVNK